MIIGFTGRKQSGKSTASGFLQDLGFELHSFSGPLKLMARCLLSDLGFRPEKISEIQFDKEAVIPGLDVSYRHLLQTLGTEWGRNLIHGDVWVMAAKGRLRKAVGNVVFDDVRFENEAAMIRSMGGLIVHVMRPWLGDADHHVSEGGIVVASDDRVIDNCGGKGLLLDQVYGLPGVDAIIDMGMDDD